MFIAILIVSSSIVMSRSSEVGSIRDYYKNDYYKNKKNVNK